MSIINKSGPELTAEEMAVILFRLGNIMASSRLSCLMKNSGKTMLWNSPVAKACTLKINSLLVYSIKKCAPEVSGAIPVKPKDLAAVIKSRALTLNKGNKISYAASRLSIPKASEPLIFLYRYFNELVDVEFFERAEALNEEYKLDAFYLIDFLLTFASWVKATNTLCNLSGSCVFDGFLTDIMSKQDKVYIEKGLPFDLLSFIPAQLSAIDGFYYSKEACVLSLVPVKNGAFSYFSLID